jgi:hypothetical protein
VPWFCFGSVVVSFLFDRAILAWNDVSCPMRNRMRSSYVYGRSSYVYGAVPGTV